MKEEGRVKEILDSTQKSKIETGKRRKFQEDIGHWEADDPGHQDQANEGHERIARGYLIFNNIGATTIHGNVGHEHELKKGVRSIPAWS